MTSRGWILAFRASKSSQAQYWFYKSKGMAEKDAEKLRSNGWEIINIYQSPAHAIVITKEEAT